MIDISWLWSYDNPLSEGASMGTTVEFHYVWGWEGSARTFPHDLLENLHV